MIPQRQPSPSFSSGDVAATLLLEGAVLAGIFLLWPGTDAKGGRAWTDLRLFGSVLHTDATLRLSSIAALAAAGASLYRRTFDVMRLRQVDGSHRVLINYALRPLVAAILGSLTVLILRTVVTDAEAIQRLDPWGVLVLAAVAGFFADTVLAKLPARLPSGTAPRDLEKPQVKTVPMDVASSRDVLARERSLRAAHEKAPLNVAVSKELIEVLKSGGKYDEAARVYDEIISDDPDNDALILEKAALYLEIGDQKRYVDVVQKANEIAEKRSFEQNVGRKITLQRIEVRDLPFFDEFTWEFQPKVNVLLGRNGYGKTHLLRAIVAMLQNDKTVTGEFVEGGGRKAGMRADIAYDGQPRETIRTLTVFEKTFGKVPVLAFPDARYIDKSQESIGPPSTVTDLRSEGARQFMRGESFEAMILTFLYDLCLDYSKGSRGFQAPIFRLVEEVVGELDVARDLNSVPHPADRKFAFHSIERKDNARFQIRVVTEGNEANPLPLQKASQGTLSVLSMVGLTYRFLKALHPKVREADVRLQPGVVIIDEIDAHLHPAWQRQILQLFRDKFPNVQFIVTAHTPLVVAGCKEREVAVLERREKRFAVRVISDHFIGATARDLYEQVFEIEDKDLEFLRLNTRQGIRPQVEQEIRELSAIENAGKALSAEQRTTLRDKRDELYYLREAAETQTRRQEIENAETGRQMLELEKMSLNGEVKRLRSALESQARLADTGVLSGLVDFLKTLAESNAVRSSAIEPLVRHLSLLGDHQQAALLLEALVKAEPDNVMWLKALAAQHEAMRKYGDAVAVLRRAAQLAPNDEALRVMMTNLERVARESTTS